MAILGVGTAGAVMGIDIINVSIKKISRIYLFDPVPKLIFIVGWISIMFFSK